MQMVKFNPYDSFVHGSYDFRRNVEQSVPEHLAREWEINGLGRVVTSKQAPTRQAKVIPEPAASAGNAVGPDVSQSASRPAPPSDLTIPRLSSGGAKPTPRGTK